MIIDDKRVDYKMRLAQCSIGDIGLELVEPLDNISIYAKFLKEFGEGLHHIGYEVDNYEEVIKFFRDKGMGVYQGGNYYGAIYTYLNTQEDLKHIIEIHKWGKSAGKFESTVSKYGIRRPIWPKPDKVYPAEN